MSLAANGAFGPRSCRFTPSGTEYQGYITTTLSGAICKSWSGTGFAVNKFRDGHKQHNYCRNPDPTVFNDGVWCYRLSDDQPEKCDVPMCRKLNEVVAGPSLMYLIVAESDWKDGLDFTDDSKPYAAINKAQSVDGWDWSTEVFNAKAVPVCKLEVNSCM